jgi:hypothetical protein
MKKNVKFFRTLWGVNLDFKDLYEVKDTLKSFKDQGFSGVEIAIGFFDKKNKKDMIKILSELEMKVITQIHTCGYPIFEHDPEKHFDDYLSKVDEALTWEPEVINCHSGRDDWNQNEYLNFFYKIQEYQKLLKMKQISHETHRQRVLNTHWKTFEVMKYLPNLYFTADLGHWVVIADRLMDNSTDKNWESNFQLFSERVVLMHPRISSTCHMQVIDPFSKYNQIYREYHENLYKTIWKYSKFSTLYCDLEYGPDPAAILDPSTGQPFKSIDKIISRELLRFKTILH